MLDAKTVHFLRLQRIYKWQYVKQRCGGSNRGGAELPVKKARRNGASEHGIQKHALRFLNMIRDMWLGERKGKGNRSGDSKKEEENVQCYRASS